MNHSAFNIFYTDDDTDDLDMFKRAASEVSSNLRVITQDNGDELIRQLENPPPYPSVIFLDLNMPRKNGYEVLEEIRPLKRSKLLPVVIFSTSDDAQVITATRQLGADLFITKPPSYSSLKKLIRHIIGINWEQFSSTEETFVYRTT